MKSFSLAGIAVAALALCAGSSFAQGMSSPNYSIPVSVLNSGGGVASSANYTLIASIGEPFIGTMGGIAVTPAVDLRIAGGMKSSRDADVNFGAADARVDGVINILDAVTIARSITNGGVGVQLDAGFLPAALQ